MVYTALFFGLISSLHCIGMCGPIAMMLPVDHKNPTKKALQILTYQLGRITSYGMLGLFFGLLGKGLFLAGFQQRLSIVVGVLMIVIALVPDRIFAQYNFSKPIYKVIASIKSKLGAQFKRIIKWFVALRNGLRCIIWRHCNAKHYVECFIHVVVWFGNNSVDEWSGVCVKFYYATIQKQNPKDNSVSNHYHRNTVYFERIRIKY